MKAKEYASMILNELKLAKGTDLIEAANKNLTSVEEITAAFMTVQRQLIQEVSNHPRLNPKSSLQTGVGVLIEIDDKWRAVFRELKCPFCGLLPSQFFMEKIAEAQGLHAVRIMVDHSNGKLKYDFPDESASMKTLQSLYMLGAALESSRA